MNDFTGFLNDPMLQINERIQADALRATTIQFVCEHVDGYIGFDDEALNTDMPQRPVFQFSSLEERNSLMSNPTAI